MDVLDHVIYFVGGGLAFFVGAALILAGVGVSPWVESRWLKLARNLAALVGGILIVISAVPLDWWLYALLATTSVAWLIIEWLTGKLSPRWPRAARIAAVAVWLLALGLELPYHFTPTLPAMGDPRLFLIGDSVSAGMSDADTGTWPKLLAKAQGIDLRDLSKMGATVGSAQKQADLIGDEPGLVLLEIGGNDLLGSTTTDQFEERLEHLLAAVCRADRTVVMLELPLPPFANRFGQIQRRLAREHGVFLVPRRVFISVLTTSGATVDGIHLTPEGHALMAETMWSVVRSAWK
jgi:acyl-CoA thioesterase-1